MILFLALAKRHILIVQEHKSVMSYLRVLMCRKYDTQVKGEFCMWKRWKISYELGSRETTFLSCRFSFLIEISEMPSYFHCFSSMVVAVRVTEAWEEERRILPRPLSTSDKLSVMHLVSTAVTLSVHLKFSSVCIFQIPHLCTLNVICCVSYQITLLECLIINRNYIMELYQCYKSNKFMACFLWTWMLYYFQETMNMSLLCA